MNIIKIGEPIITKRGTVVTRYIENGRLFKSIDFEKSSNSAAKKQCLVKTVVRYGEENKPETVFDTFERRIGVNTDKTAPIKKKEPAPKPTTPTVTQEKETPQIAVPKKKEVTTEPTEDIKPVNNQQNKQKLVPISADSFKKETAKLMYSKIQKLIKRLGDSGNMSDVRILGEKGAEKSDTDIYLSVNKDYHKTYLDVYRKSVNSGRETLFNALFNRDGQMTDGNFPSKAITFERRGANVRRMMKYSKIFMPVANNDREWDYLGGRISESCRDSSPLYQGDTHENGAFEIFIEFARLYTSILK